MSYYDEDKLTERLQAVLGLIVVSAILGAVGALILK